MRIQMHMSRDAKLALREVKRLEYGDTHIEITNAYLVGVAYKRIKDRPIDWLEVATANVPNVTDDTTSSIQAVKTTLNLELSVDEGITALQTELNTVFDNKRVHRSFVVKLVLLAFVLDKEGLLPLLEDEPALEPQTEKELEKSEDFKAFLEMFHDDHDESVEF